MNRFLSTLPVLLSLLNLVSAAQKSVTLDIVNAPIAPDGFMRIYCIRLSASCSFPGPVITAQKGDSLSVQVNNKLTDGSMRLSTSIDFDGLNFDTDNVYNEGSPFVTTCPFGPNTSYTYGAPGNQTGSYWYHSSLSLQYADGLRGALVIYDPEDPQKDLYDVDDESTIWTVADWWHNTSTVGLISYNLTQIIPFLTGLAVASSKGRGRYNGGPAVPYAVQNVTKGTRYRFRLINISARTFFTVSIDNRESFFLYIIEADGLPTQPHEVNVLDIMPGQRYSIVVTADQPADNYWINTILHGGNAAFNLNLNSTLGRGILRYEGAPDQEPTTPMTLGPQGAAANALVESDLRPLFPTPAPEPDYNLTFVTNMPVNKTIWTINDIQYIPPNVPTLIQVLDGASNDSDFGLNENTFVFPRNKVIQITFPPDPDNELHPFTLHGQNFWLVKSNSSGLINTENPIRRNVAAAGSNGTILRFTTDQPGPWFSSQRLPHL
ncbi:Cu-oxidase-domain-containing protein [Roridomyces roridus]|uniref:Cu-oxidase-domain-containing protein n=1 Tax=Roridomyces roridus TaxID=1738132 RepID=A0AAD7BMP6_9AGAR|nr:Cu-oxidase-domain-containing protein [Roridomyces roridus]